MDNGVPPVYMFPRIIAAKQVWCHIQLLHSGQGNFAESARAIQDDFGRLQLTNICFSECFHHSFLFVKAVLRFRQKSQHWVWFLVAVVAAAGHLSYGLFLLVVPGFNGLLDRVILQDFHTAPPFNKISISTAELLLTGA